MEICARQLQYFSWNWLSIIKHGAGRRISGLSTLENYAVLAGTLLLQMCVSSFFYNVDCEFLPRPAVCNFNLNYGAYAVVLALWDCIVTGIGSTIITIPISVAVKLIFRKTKVYRKPLNTSRFRATLHLWLVKTSVFWLSLSAAFTVALVHLVNFAYLTDAKTVNRWIASSTVSIVAKIFALPIATGILFSIPLTISQYLPTCDSLVYLLAEIAPVRPEDGSSDVLEIRRKTSGSVLKSKAMPSLVKSVSLKASDSYVVSDFNREDTLEEDVEEDKSEPDEDDGPRVES